MNLSKNFLNLSEVSINKRCIVKKIGFKGSKLQRFYDLGIAYGTEIIPIFKSVFGDPTAYMIFDSIFAIRNVDAKLITVELIKDF